MYHRNALNSWAVQTQSSGVCKILPRQLAFRSSIKMSQFKKFGCMFATCPVQNILLYFRFSEVYFNKAINFYNYAVSVMNKYLSISGGILVREVGPNTRWNNWRNFISFTTNPIWIGLELKSSTQDERPESNCLTRSKMFDFITLIIFRNCKNYENLPLLDVMSPPRNNITY